MCVSPPVPRDTMFSTTTTSGFTAKCTAPMLTDTAQRRHCQLVVKQCGTPRCAYLNFNISMFSRFTHVQQHKSLDFSAFCLPSQGLICSKRKVLMLTAKH